MILDTSYVIALVEGDTDAVAIASEHEGASLPQRLPSTVLSELYVAVGAGDDPTANVRKYEELVGNLPIVDVDDNIARRAGVYGANASRAIRNRHSGPRTRRSPRRDWSTTNPSSLTTATSRVLTGYRLSLGRNPFN